MVRHMQKLLGHIEVYWKRKDFLVDGPELQLIPVCPMHELGQRSTLSQDSARVYW